MTTIIINDLALGDRITMVMDDTDFGVVRGNWTTEDKLLADMQGHSLFAGRTRWCDLDPTHWRVLLLQAFEKFNDIAAPDRADSGNPVVKTLTFCLCGLVHRIETASEITVELMQVQRVNRTTINYSVTGSLGYLETDPPIAPSLRVVVDNQT